MPAVLPKLFCSHSCPTRLAHEASPRPIQTQKHKGDGHPMQHAPPRPCPVSPCLQSRPHPGWASGCPSVCPWSRFLFYESLTAGLLQPTSCSGLAVFLIGFCESFIYEGCLPLGSFLLIFFSPHLEKKGFFNSLCLLASLAFKHSQIAGI